MAGLPTRSKLLPSSTKPQPAHSGEWRLLTRARSRDLGTTPMKWGLLALHQGVLHCTRGEEPRDGGRLAACAVAEELCDSRSLWRHRREVMDTG